MSFLQSPSEGAFVRPVPSRPERSQVPGGTVLSRIVANWTEDAILAQTQISRQRTECVQLLLHVGMNPASICCQLTDGAHLCCLVSHLQPYPPPLRTALW